MTSFQEIVPGRLWQVENLLNPAQVKEIINIDWLSLPWKSLQKKNFPRREIIWDCPQIQKAKIYIDNKLLEINQATGSNFSGCAGHFWVDEPGFVVDMHTDGHLDNALQMYWIVNDETFGTGFYNFKNRDTLLYQFKSVCNTGYFMLNHPNEDGSQPLQWHGMFNPVPAGTIRVTSYWHFY